MNPTPSVCVNCGDPADIRGNHPEADYVNVCFCCARGQGITFQRPIRRVTVPRRAPEATP